MKNRVISCGRCIFSFYEPNKNAVFSKCRVFGEKIEGKIVHDYSSECRKDEKKCGSIGREYIDKFI